MKGNTLNKLKEEDARKQLNQGGRRTFKQTHIIRPNDGNIRISLDSS